MTFKNTYYLIIPNKNVWTKHFPQIRCILFILAGIAMFILLLPSFHVYDFFYGYHLRVFVLTTNVCLNVAHLAQLLIRRVKLEKRMQQEILIEPFTLDIL